MTCISGANIVEDGLVLHLDAANIKSYSGSGTVWKDLSGNGNDGTLVNDVGFDIGNGGTVVFDGVDDIVTLGYKQSLLPSDITQEAWVKASSFASWNGIVSKMPGWGTGFSLQIGSTQGIAAMISGSYLRTSWQPLLNTWYHIVATHNSANDFNVLYVNAAIENTSTRSVSYSQNAVTSVGVFYTGGSLPFSGKISQIRTYNRALSESEIKQNFEATRGRYGI